VHVHRLGAQPVGQPGACGGLQGQEQCERNGKGKAVCVLKTGVGAWWLRAYVIGGGAEEAQGTGLLLGRPASSSFTADA